MSVVFEKGKKKMKLTKYQKSLGREIRKLWKKEAALSLKVEVLRAKCKHPTLVYKHKADTGNYDPSQDSYWTDWFCSLCGERGTADGSVQFKVGTQMLYGTEIDYTELSDKDLK
jgi:hypothetical protein